MAQWRNLEELSRTNKDVSERIDLIYNNEGFVFKIRILCADFIEKDNWVDSTATDGLEGFLESLEEMGQSGDLKHKMSIKHDIKTLKGMTEDEAYSFVQMMKRCIKQEQQLIESLYCQSDDRRASKQNVAVENVKITSEMDQIGQALMQLEQTVIQLEKEQENFNMELANFTGEITELSEKTTSGDVKKVKQLEERKTALIQNLYQNRTIVAELLEGVDSPLSCLFEDVWVDIDAWKRQQLLQITGLTKPPEKIMDVLGQMCERAGELLCTAQRLAEKILTIYQNLLFQDDPLVPKVKEIAEHFDSRLQKHALKIFVVDRPPPQIIKVVNTKSSAFSMSVRLLGASTLAVQAAPCKVTAELFREKDLGTAMTNHQMAGMCQVTNGKDKIMEFGRNTISSCTTKTGTLVANFTKVCLEKAQRTERSREDLVTDNKYFMVFYTQVMLNNKTVQLVTHSLPIILISHVLQECTARATLVWNAAFPLETGQPYDEEKVVTWARVAEVLDALFYMNTERHLTPEQLNYLASVAFRNRKENIDFSEKLIMRNKLLKDHLYKVKNKEKEHLSRNFSFWKWFYANMNLLKERLKREWLDGFIYGFVSKDMATRLLTGKPDGTFLLRFSESSIEASMKADICGCITVAVTTRNPHTGQPDVFHIKDHLATKDILNSTLVGILDMFEYDDASGRKQRLLHYLWPDRSFDTFKDYLPHRDDTDDYKHGRVTITIQLCPDEGRHRRSSQQQPMSPISFVSDLDDMSITGSPGSVSSVQSPGVSVPTPSNVVTVGQPKMFQSNVPDVVSNDQAFVPGRLQGLAELTVSDLNSILQCDNGDVMLPADFQLGATAMDS